LHQGAEYLLGLVLVAQGLQSPTPTVPALAGGLVILNAAIVDGPLGAFRAVSRRQHRWLDLVVIGVLVVAALVPGLDVDNTSRALLLSIAAILGFVWWNTSFEPRPATSSGSFAQDAAGFAGRAVGSATRAVRSRRQP
jgi:hypothetical protein